MPVQRASLGVTHVIQLMSQDASTAIECQKLSTRQILAATISRGRIARVVPKICQPRKFGTYPLSTRNDFAVFSMQNPSYRHLNLKNG
jgi:hypothetical protein